MPSSKASSTRPKPALRQSSLSFTSKRSGGSGKEGKGKGKAADSGTNTPVGGQADEEASEGEDEEEIAKRTYASDGFEQPEPPSKRRRVVEDNEQGKVKDTDASPQQGVFRSRTSIENASGGKTHSEAKPTEERPSLTELNKKGRLRKLYGEVRAKMGHLEPIHGKGLTNVHHILRVFDLSYEYGPCIGMTRLQRWERAHVLGLNPPAEVKEILTTKEGIEKDEYSQCVFHGEV